MKISYEDDEYLYLTCQCRDMEHTCRFTMMLPFEDENEEEDIPDIWVELLIDNYKSIWKRIWYSLKYIFKKCPYVGSVSTIIMRKDTDKVIEFFKKFNEQYDKRLINLKNYKGD